jgi:hypothetical protein
LAQRPSRTRQGAQVLSSRRNTALRQEFPKAVKIRNSRCGNALAPIYSTWLRLTDPTAKEKLKVEQARRPPLAPGLVRRLRARARARRTALASGSLARQRGNGRSVPPPRRPPAALRRHLAYYSCRSAPPPSLSRAIDILGVPWRAATVVLVHFNAILAKAPANHGNRNSNQM